jgi:hypothetical protein
MNLPALLERSRVEIKLGSYGVASATALADPSMLPRVQEYRRQAGSRTMPLDRDDIATKIPAANYHVSRKVDGEFTVLVFRDGQVFTLNPGGTVRVGLPWEDEAARLLSNSGVREAMVAGELYVTRDDRRSRVHDVTTLARQPQSAADVERLQFAVFDILSLDGAAPAGSFAETWKNIQRLFGKGQRIHPVEAKQVSDSAGIEKLFAQWVEGEGAEGLVVRSDTAGMFKIKPRHSLDAVVIGFTESIQERQGMLHDMLLAVMRQDGTLQVLSRVGGGLSEDERRAMLSDLKDMVVESEYAEVNSDHVAYQMVQPDWVVEISCLDMISETTRGGPVNRMVLDYRSNGSKQYHVVRRLPLAAVISPQFVRRREDKKVRREDIRIEQVSEVVEVTLADRDARQMTLPKSELLRREVYTKQLKGETMIRKFVLWKTNKEQQGDEYPAYVLHFTDFSPNRQTPLSRDVRVSSSLEQMRFLWEELKTENIKKGWDLHSTAEFAPKESVPEPAPVAAEPTPPIMAESKPARKKTAKKKSG